MKTLRRVSSLVTVRFIGAFFLWALGSSSLSLGHMLDVPQFVTSHGAELQEMASNQQAITFFFKYFKDSVTIEGKHKRRQGPPPLSSYPGDFPTDLTHFVADLALSRLSTTIQDAVQISQPEGWQALADTTTPYRQWLSSQVPSPLLTQTENGINALSVLIQPHTSLTPTPVEYPAFSTFLDAQYPSIIGTPDSWLTLLAKHGMAGVQARFHEFWNSPDFSPPAASSESQRAKGQQASGMYFLRTRIQPVLTAQILAHAIRLRIDAEEHAREIWNRLQRWNSTQRSQRDRARLCGTWQWLMHNHQNHSDHKMKMTFTLQGQQTNQPQPARVIMNGNTAFLRWEFPQGFQEDSLLLSKHDHLIEGTFVNSLGPHGIITGRRLTPCNPPK